MRKICGLVGLTGAIVALVGTIINRELLFHDPFEPLFVFQPGLVTASLCMIFAILMLRTETVIAPAMLMICSLVGMFMSAPLALVPLLLSFLAGLLPVVDKLNKVIGLDS